MGISIALCLLTNVDEIIDGFSRVRKITVDYAYE